MKLWLVTNEWLVWDKFEQQYAALAAAAGSHPSGDICLERHSNAWIAANLHRLSDAELPQLALVMDKDIRVLALLEARSIRLVNSAHAVAVCDDKALTYARLRAAGIGQPLTIPVPLAFHPLSAQQWESSPWVAQVEEDLGYPLMFKHAVGSWGSGVFLIHNREELLSALVNNSHVACLVQQYIGSSHGRDMRVFMVGDTAVAAMERRGAGDDVRANLTGGGAATSVQPSDEHVDTARRVMKALGLDIAGVDFLFGPHGTPLVCEVNSNAQFMSLSHITGVDVAAAIMDYMAHLGGLTSHRKAQP